MFMAITPSALPEPMMIGESKNRASKMAANEQMDVSDDESFEEEYGSDEGEGFPGDEEEDEEMTEEEQAVATEEALARLANLQCSLEDAERETGE